MRKFVSPNRSRRPAKRFIVRTEAKKTPGWKLFLFYYGKQIVGALVVIVAWYAFFFHNWSPIERVVFSAHSQETLGYQPIYDKISSDLVGKGYFRQKWWERNSWVDSIKSEFNIVQDVIPSSFENGTLTIDIAYRTPDFILNTTDQQRFIVFNNTLLPYNSGALLGTTGIFLNITIPEEQLQAYSGGVFWGTKSPEIVRAIKRITFLGTGDLDYTYYPGREKLRVKGTKDTFIIGLQSNKLQETIAKRQHILPYLPSEMPSIVDLSNPNRIIITY